MEMAKEVAQNGNMRDFRLECNLDADKQVVQYGKCEGGEAYFLKPKIPPLVFLAKEGLNFGTGGWDSRSE